MGIVYFLIGVLFLLIAIFGCILCYVIGYMSATKEQTVTERAKPPPELSQEEKQKQEKEKREHENFMSYDGSAQT